MRDADLAGSGTRRALPLGRDGEDRTGDVGAAGAAGARAGELAGGDRLRRPRVPAAGAALLRPDAGLYPVLEAARGEHDHRGRAAGRGGDSPQEAPEAAAGLGGGRERALGGRPRHGGRRGRGPRHGRDRPRAAAAEHPDEGAVPPGVPRPLPELRGRSERARRPVLLRRTGARSPVGGAGLAPGADGEVRLDAVDVFHLREARRPCRIRNDATPRRAATAAGPTTPWPSRPPRPARTAARPRCLTAPARTAATTTTGR